MTILRAALVDKVESLWKREDPTLVGEFLDRVDSRSRNELRSHWNLLNDQLRSDPHTVPDDFGEMVLLEVQRGGEWVAAEPRGAEMIADLTGVSGSAPYVYHIEQAPLTGNIILRPDTTEDIRISYYAELDSSTSINDQLEDYYLAAAMVYASEWSEDYQALEYWTGRHRDIVSELNTAYRNRQQVVSYAENGYGGGTIAV